MKPSSRQFLHVVTLGAALAIWTAAGAAEVEPIVTPAKRAEVLEKGKHLLAAKELPATVPNPFFTEAFAEALATSSGKPASTAGAAEGGDAVRPVVPAGPKTGRDLLQAIAMSLKPSGYFVIGGEPTLVFGQKRVKAGGTLTITFEGTEYTLEVVSLDRTNFTLRLNREEFTRPIK
jgi:hypothetical protein